MDLYRKIEATPTFDFKGSIVGMYIFKDQITKVLITKEKTINRNMIKINLYFRGKKEFSTRVNKDNYNKYTVDDMLKWFWFSKRSLSFVKGV